MTLNQILVALEAGLIDWKWNSLSAKEESIFVVGMANNLKTVFVCKIQTVAGRNNGTDRERNGDFASGIYGMFP